MGLGDKVRSTAQASYASASGDDFLRQGDVIRAEEMFRQAIEAIEGFGLAHPPVRRALWNHAISLVYVGQYGLAHERLRQALTIVGRQGPFDPLAAWDNPHVRKPVKVGAVQVVIDLYAELRRDAGEAPVLDPSTAFPALATFCETVGHPGETPGFQCLMRAWRGEQITEVDFE